MLLLRELADVDVPRGGSFASKQSANRSHVMAAAPPSRMLTTYPRSRQPNTHRSAGARQVVWQSDVHGAMAGARDDRDPQGSGDRQLSRDHGERGIPGAG